ncbi:MCE family protein [Candidatus Mycobacterium wuenschmannii]|uniref:MCE family protein n=1 Tax=Candidatus Mycobacterium wuenschmannii TaxID=3027808 RepID=UPI0028BD8F7C|nr:MCE family protein [Candidatus Mycobacterium wuenschmannii]
MSAPWPPIPRRIARLALAAVLVAVLASVLIVARPGRRPPLVVTAQFASSIGLYPGDEVKIAGIPVGSVVSITPRAEATTIVLSIDPTVRVPAEAQAILIDPNLVSARFIELAPLYTSGPTLASGAVIPQSRTATPVEWDQVKDELTKLATQLGPQAGSLQGPLTRVVNQAADTFDGQGESFRTAVHELARTAGRLGDDRTDLLGTIKNLHIVVDALSASNTQIVQFSNHVAAVSQVLADSTADLNTTLGTLNHALGDVRNFLRDNNDALIGQVDRLSEFTTLLNDHSDDLQQVLHIAPHGLANFYNIYNPAQASLSGILTLPNLANPVQFICGSFDGGGGTDNIKRAEICRERMAPVLKRLTMNYPPILFHPINAINAYKGQTIYDTPQTQEKAQTPISQLQWIPAPGVTPPHIAPDAP